MEYYLAMLTLTRALVVSLLLTRISYAGGSRVASSCQIINGRQVCAPQVVNSVVKSYVPYQRSYIQQNTQPLVLYGVAPYMQAQAQDQYHFSGSKERLELEYLRGHAVAAQQFLNVLQQQLQTQQQDNQDLDAVPSEQQNEQQVPLAPNPGTLPVPLPTQQGQIQPQELKDLGVRPLVSMYCARCHSADKKSGGLQIDSNIDVNGAEHDAFRGLVSRALNDGRMPLGADKQPVKLPDNVIHAIMQELNGEPEVGKEKELSVQNSNKRLEQWQ